MLDLIPFADIGHLFRDFKHTAWRLESRRAYAADLITSRYQHFLQTGQLLDDSGDPWVANVAEQLAQGKRFERVRIVDDPLTDNQRYMLTNAVRRPEDIRVLSRSQAEAAALPPADFWLFDSAVLATMHFDETDRTLGVELTEETSAVLAACQVRDAAWHYAMPARRWAAAVPSLM